mgnify:CR=1 FL=1
MLFEKTNVFNFDGAFRGLRNPMNSHSKSDSYTCDETHCIGCPYDSENDDCNFHQFSTINNPNVFVIGKNDMNLAQRMIKGGNPNDKFLRQILICVDITANRGWWQEYSTYKVGTVEDSESTMHTIHKQPFDLSMFEYTENTKEDIKEIINLLEKHRQEYLNTKDFKYVVDMKTILPESFLQKRTVTMNYEIIRNMIRQRYNHRLPQWRIDFINWCHTLPYSKELLFYCNGDDKNE